MAQKDKQSEKATEIYFISKISMLNIMPTKGYSSDAILKYNFTGHLAIRESYEVKFPETFYITITEDPGNDESTLRYYKDESDMKNDKHFLCMGSADACYHLTVGLLRSVGKSLDKMKDEEAQEKDEDQKESTFQQVYKVDFDELRDVMKFSNLSKIVANAEFVKLHGVPDGLEQLVQLPNTFYISIGDRLKYYKTEVDVRDNKPFMDISSQNDKFILIISFLGMVATPINDQLNVDDILNLNTEQFIQHLLANISDELYMKDEVIQSIEKSPELRVGYANAYKKYHLRKTLMGDKLTHPVQCCRIGGDLIFTQGTY